MTTLIYVGDEHIYRVERSGKSANLASVKVKIVKCLTGKVDTIPVGATINVPLSKIYLEEFTMNWETES